MTSKGLAILGISLGEGPGAALLVDGSVVAAAQQEAGGFPLAAVGYCMRHAGIGLVDLDFVALDTVPRAAFNSALMASRTLGFRTYLETLQPWITSGLAVRRRVLAALGGGYRGPIAFIDRRQALAAAADHQSTVAAGAALVVWHQVLAYPRRNGSMNEPVQVRPPQIQSSDTVVSTPIRWLVTAALTAAYPLLRFGSPSFSETNHGEPKRASDYFSDSFASGSPGAAASFLSKCANVIAHVRELPRMTAPRRVAREEIPDDIYTLW